MSVFRSKGAQDWKSLLSSDVDELPDCTPAIEVEQQDTPTQRRKSLKRRKLSHSESEPLVREAAEPPPRFSSLPEDPISVGDDDDDVCITGTTTKPKSSTVVDDPDLAEFGISQEDLMAVAQKKLQNNHNHVISHIVSNAKSALVSSRNSIQNTSLSLMSADAEIIADNDTDKINIIATFVNSPNPKYKQIKLKIFASKPFSDLRNVVANFLVVDPSCIVLKFDGVPLSCDSTPKDHFINDGDKITVTIQPPTTSKQTTNVATTITTVEDDLDDEEKAIEAVANAALTQAESISLSQAPAKGMKIKVKSKESTQIYRLQDGDPIRKIFDLYCTQAKLDPRTVRFMFDGDKVDLNKTPSDYDMEDGDILDAVVKPIK